MRPTAICKECRRTTPSTMGEIGLDAEETKRIRNDRIARGLCRDCAHPAVPGRRQCEHHLEAQRRYSKRSASKRRAST